MVLGFAFFCMIENGYPIFCYGRDWLPIKSGINGKGRKTKCQKNMKLKN